MFDKEKDERYIRMCGCPEVQGHRKEFKEGDILANYREEWEQVNADTQKAKRIFDSMVVFYGPITHVVARRLVVWLPRQSDIQDMLGYDFPFIARQFSAYVEDCMEPEKFGSVLKTQFTSMHEFWLGFYFLEAHKKVWDFGQWKHIQIWNAKKKEWEDAKPEEKKK